MQKNVIIGLGAVAVVAIIIGAGIGVYLANSNDKKIPGFEKDTGTVYGNADGNCYIDENDITVMRSIMDGKSSLNDYPFADANCDGEVNNDDIAIVNKYLAKEECTLKVLDSEEKVIDVKYPITNIMVLCGSNLAPLMNVLDVSDRIVGAAYTSNKFDPVRDYPIDQGVKNGTITKLTTDGTAADFTAITNLKDKKDCHFFMTELSSMYPIDSDENVTVLNGMGIDVVRMEARDPGQDLRSLAVFGILLNKSDNVKEYQDYINSVYKNIGDKIGDTAHKKVLISSLTSNLSGPGSGYTVMLNMAKLDNVITTGDSSQKVKDGDTWFLDPKYASDFLYLGSSCGYNDTGFKAKDITTYTDLYKNHNAWKTNNAAYIYSTSIPVVVRVAYYAETAYPDLFEDGFAHNLHQEYVDKYFKAPEYKVNDDLCMKKISS
jgi:ABC-type Fe3+-hydroxamate transport system substrate-binding protein